MGSAPTGFDQLAQAGVQSGYDQIQRKRDAVTEQRLSREQLLRDAALRGEVPLGDAAKGIDSLYAHEPQESRMSRVGQFLRTVTGQKQQGRPAPTSGPQASSVAPTGPAPQQNGYMDVLSRAKTPQQVQQESQQSQQDSEISGYGAKFEAYKKAAAGKTAEEQAQLAQMFGIAPKVNVKNVRLQDGSVIGMDINQGLPPGASLAPTAGASKVVQLSDKEGKPFYGTESGGKFYDSSGNAVPDAKPFVKAGNTSPGQQYMNLYAKKLLADHKQGPPLTPQEAASLQAAGSELGYAGVARANAMAEAQARYGITNVTGDDGTEIAVTRKQAAVRAQGGNPYSSGTVGAPTGEEKTRQDFATSMTNRITRMREIIKHHPEIFGPVGGRTMKASVWIGSQDPDAQIFLNDSTVLADHSAAVFGSRSQKVAEMLQQVQSNPNTNPAALDAGLAEAGSIAQDFMNPGGRLPSASKGPGPKKSAAHTYAIDDQGKRRKVLDSKAQLPQGWKWAD
jgi:hypothetical protein